MTSILETHPYNDRYPVPSNTRCLVIGTAPPPRFSNSAIKNAGELDFDFYYGSETNLMWPILEDVSERRFGHRLFEDQFSSEQCVEIAQKFLRDHHIWMRDVLQSYRRKPGNAASAADNHIVPPPDAKFASFRAEFDNPNLSKIAFTSQIAAIWALSAFAEQELIENADEVSSTYRQWSRIGPGIPPEELYRVKFTQPFAHAKVRICDCAMFILPAPLNRVAPRKQEKGKIYEQVLFGS